MKEVDHPCHTSCSKTLLGRDLQISLLFHWKCLASSLTGTPSLCTAEVYSQVFGLPRFFLFKKKNERSQFVLALAPSHLGPTEKGAAFTEGSEPGGMRPSNLRFTLVD